MLRRSDGGLWCWLSERRCMLVCRGRPLMSWLAKKFAKVRTKVRELTQLPIEAGHLQQTTLNVKQRTSQIVYNCSQIHYSRWRYASRSHNMSNSSRSPRWDVIKRRRAQSSFVFWVGCTLIARHCHLPPRHARNMICLHTTTTTTTNTFSLCYNNT